MVARFLVLVRISLANITSSLLNLFVGLVLLFGAALLVVGGSLFATLDDALNRSVVDSVTGHLQIYGSRSKDPLEVYGKVDGSDSKLAPIDDFKTLKARLLAMPNVETVVPMGAATALVGTSSTVDQVLERLRSLYRAQNDPATRLSDEDFTRESRRLIAHTRHIVDVLAKDLARADELQAATAETLAERKALAEAQSPEFWATFEAEPLDHLELLENKVAPIMGDADLLFIRALGTDLAAYQATFTRMRIVEGKPVPANERGLLLPRFFYDEFLKLKSARRLDKMKLAREAGRKLNDLEDKELQRFLRENQSQTREFLLQLDEPATATAVERLRGLLGGDERDLGKLLTQFFTTTDENFDQRYAFFYEQLAPLLTLYRVKVGDEVTLRSFGNTGAVQTVLLKLHGIFEYQGLEKSPLAGTTALTDMLTFRDLYGFMTAERKAELERIRAEAKTQRVSRDEAEDALFGGDAEIVSEVQAQTIEAPSPEPSERQPRATRTPSTFDPEEIDDGVVLNAAVMLKDSSALATFETRREIERLLFEPVPPSPPEVIDAAQRLVDSKKLSFMLAAALGQVVQLERQRAAGESVSTSDALMDLQEALKVERPNLTPEAIDTVQRLIESARPLAWVVTWDRAAGFLGKFIQFFRGMLAAIIAAFAFIALIVVTIGMTIATLQRTATIGTLRAIGAQRTFVVAMVQAETLVLALVFGAVGTVVGALIVAYLHARGIPAFRDELYFFFSGPVLRPEVTPLGMALGFGVTLAVSLAAVLVPTLMAIRVAPVTAMRGSE